MNVQRCRTAGLAVLLALAVFMFTRSALALDGQVREDAPILHQDMLRSAPHATTGWLWPGVHSGGAATLGWLSEHAPWSRPLLDPVLLPLGLGLRDESGAGRGIAEGDRPLAPQGTGPGAPYAAWVDRLLAIPLRPVQIGESRLRPLDPKPSAGVVVKLPF